MRSAMKAADDDANNRGVVGISAVGNIMNNDDDSAGLSRQPRGNNNNNTNDNERDDIGSKRRWLSRTAGRRNLTSGQEEAFINMQLRKMNRAMSGTKSRDTKYEYAALFLVLVLIFSIFGGVKYFWFETYSAETKQQSDSETDDQYLVKLTFPQVIWFTIWLFCAVVVTSVFRESRFIALLYLMLVYIPLIFLVADAVFSFKLRGSVFAVVTEVLALAVFVFVYYLFPRIINSGWFRRKGRAVRYFRVKLISDWTMSYTRRSGRCGLGRLHTCKYDGATNDKGQPHGIGRWFDDAFEGEILTGAWENGVPVAPFSSRIYGTGDAFRAVLVPFFKASDDSFESTKLWPTNENPVECGVASVECSVSGAFYNELPEAKYFIDPHPFDLTTSIQKMYDSLLVIQQKVDMQYLAIMADDPRGIQIEGHVHAATGRAFHQVDEISVRVKKEETKPLIRPNLPMISSVAVNQRRVSFFGLEKLFIHDDECEVSPDDESAPTAQAPTDHSQDYNNKLAEAEEGRTSTPPQFSLEVDGWVKSEKKDALIFFPGFNSSLKKSLENFGQLLAMTKLDSRVYPILFNWPAGQVLTYLSSSRTALSEQNCKNFHQLLSGLQHEGFRNVHLMSHSMGVQTLLGALIDKEDGSRSESSRCFALASDYDELIPNEDNEAFDESKLLICKTITLLNPDFPLVPFREHAFSAARKLCRTITVVGDKMDNALFWSQVLNGLAVRSGYEQPFALLPNDDCKKKLQHLRTVGRCVESLYFPKLESSIVKRDYLIFKEKAPLMLLYDKNKASDKSWMDLDVIDTTGLDTNMKKIRHSAFNLNASLFNDLDELITTGKRAMDRSLLYRDGNIFSYCSAPSFVNM
ncbi:hypothetical protein ACHAXA_010092 [Cyclostephanos tholiformis]|uniref:Uncharacterized protein n=1 Tax=Cyclostephanos tholiformis TaxID=382380 RepID=A0ABD3RTF0_9STRA